MIWILAYLVFVALLTAAIVAATSDRLRSHFRWLVQDEPMTPLERTILAQLTEDQPR